MDDELSDQWSRSEPNQDEKFSVNMHKRLSALKLVDNKTQLEILVKENVQVARKICVEMEIQANIDSPGKDKELRMQCQLDNLKKDFGQQKSNNKSSLELIRELTMEFLCLGPLNKTDRDKYASRINAAQQKVGSF